MVKNKSIMGALIIAVCLSMNSNANERNIDTINEETQQIKDITIKWLDENSTLYTGSDISIEAYVNGVIDNSVFWNVHELDGKSDIINIEPLGSKVKVYANDVGRAELMVHSNDETNSTRNIVVKVENYPEDDLSQLLIATNIIPIKSNIINTTRLLQVEVDKNMISSNDKVITMDNYLKKLANQGTISIQKIITEHYEYDYYVIKIDGYSDLQIEVRVDRNDDSYIELTERLNSIDSYNNDEIPDWENPDGEMPDGDNPNVENPDGENPDGDNPDGENPDGENPNGENPDGENPDGDNPNVENPDGENPDGEIPDVEEDYYIVSKEEITQGLEDIVIIDGYGDSDNPVRIQVNRYLSVDESMDVLQEYIGSIREDSSMILVEKRETAEHYIYKYKISKRITHFPIFNAARFNIINDFYIELIIEKDGTVEYKPIISMLDEMKYDKDTDSSDDEDDGDDEDSDNGDLDDDDTSNNLDKENSDELDELETDDTNLEQEEDKESNNNLLDNTEEDNNISDEDIFNDYYISEELDSENTLEEDNNITENNIEESDDNIDYINPNEPVSNTNDIEENINFSSYISGIVAIVSCVCVLWVIQKFV